jgi:hypothetical protein
VTKISDLLNKNSIPTDTLEIESASDYVTIKDSYDIESIFGKIIGIKEYKIKIYLKASLKDDIVIIEKE